MRTAAASTRGSGGSRYPERDLSRQSSVALVVSLEQFVASASATLDSEQKVCFFCDIAAADRVRSIRLFDGRSGFSALSACCLLSGNGFALN